MNEHVEPTIAATLHRYWPHPAPQPAISAAEQARADADLHLMLHREQLRDEHAMRLQLRYGD